MTTQTDQTPPLEQLAQRFVRFADQECGAYAPFYDRLARAVAADPDLLAIAAHTRAGQQAPNLLLAAIHYLLLRGISHPLAAWYPSVGGTAEREGDLSAALHSFCLQYQGDLIHLVSTRLVQTNEVRRCSFLLPAFGEIARQVAGRPLALIEVGASAGLNLLFDRYAYLYDSHLRWGDPSAPVVIRCEVRGGAVPPLPARPPVIASRLGIDLNPIHADDTDGTLWLRALVWPEQPERAELLRQALETARHDPPALTVGDALQALPDAAAAVPMDVMVCIFHTNTLAHFPAEARERFRALISQLAQGRDLCWLYSEGPGLPGPEPGLPLRLVRFVNGTPTERVLAVHHAHGAWIAWQAGAAGNSIALRRRGP